MAPETIRFSILLPVHHVRRDDGEAVFTEALARLRSCIERRDDAELLLALDRPNRTARAVAASASEWARLVESGRPGDAAARNAALPHARGALLLFTDADCWVANDWLDRAARMAEEGVRAAAGRVRHPPTPRGWATAATCFPHFQALRPGWTRNLCTANAMLHRDLLADGFPDVQNCGDRLLAWRLARKGERIRYAGDWHVEHRPLLEDRAFLHRAEAYARATVEARRRDPSLPGGGLLRFGAVAATAGWTAYRSLRDLETLLRHHAAMDLPLRQINAAVRQCLRFRRAYANALARLLRENAAEPPDGAEETA